MRKARKKSKWSQNQKKYTTDQHSWFEKIFCDIQCSNNVVDGICMEWQMVYYLLEAIMRNNTVLNEIILMLQGSTNKWSRLSPTL